MIELLRQINQILTSATVIVAVSMLLYNLAHGYRERVTRVASLLLLCVSIIYLGDVMMIISKSPKTVEAYLRLRWIGIAYAPAALFHLSDALLETTGMKSRGRRRRVVRLLYLYGAVFLATGTMTNLVAHDLMMQPAPLMQPGPFFGLYVMYYVGASLFAFNNVLRARRRCLTRATHRRMSYLLFALITPVAGIFPYTLLFPQPSGVDPFWLWFVINIGHLGIVLMLIFMAYPLSYFGPHRPDRVIKAELLSFMLRGPVTGIAVLGVIIAVPNLAAIGLPGPDFMPFIAVTTVLALQWSYVALIPFLERKLIYTQDQDQSQKVQEFAAHLFTEADARQLLEANLAALCDYLRVPSAFAASVDSHGARIEQSIGSLLPSHENLESPELMTLLTTPPPVVEPAPVNGNSPRTVTMPPVQVFPWQSFWIIPLYSNRGNGSHNRLIGIVGTWARSPGLDLLRDEEKVLKALCVQMARVLDDIHLQQELFARLEDVIEETSVMRMATDPAPWDVTQVARFAEQDLNRDVLDDPEFATTIRNALRDYWGGPRLTDDQLTRLKLVEQALPENENNPAKAVRAVLQKAIDRLKPEGARSLTLPEWTMYNILDLRFVQGKKVREAVRSMVMTEPDFYRKQKLAIDRVTQEIIDMERRVRQG